MRTKGSLQDVSQHLLKALKTHIRISFRAVSNEERECLEAEIDRLIFNSPENAENFLREYLEPQLEDKNCQNSHIGLLCYDKAFSHLKGSLSIEWLNKFQNLPLTILYQLFNIAAQYSKREELQEVISDYCSKIMSDFPNKTENKEIEEKRIFWLIRAWYFCNTIPETYWQWLKEDKNTVLTMYEYSENMNHGDYSYWPKITPNKVWSILDAFIDKWPKVDLPSHWGTGSPKEENAYRFLTNIIWRLNADNTHDDSLVVIKCLLDDDRFIDMHDNLKSIYTDQIRRKKLRDFSPPTPRDIVNLLDTDEVVTVEGLRQLILQELESYQRDIDGSEFNCVNRFYSEQTRLDEVKSTEIIAERLHLRLQAQGIIVTPEHHLKDDKRSDFTVAKVIDGRRKLLVAEVKGQWHKELYTAASAQLYDRYSIHPDAEKQGIFLAIWFGDDEKVAGSKTHNIQNAQQLKESIESKLPLELVGLIDVFVLDVSR